MSQDRRRFLVATGLVAGGAALSAFSLKSQTPQIAASGNPSQDLGRAIDCYGSLIKESSGAKGETHMAVKLSSRERFAELYSNQHKLPFDQVRSLPGNKLEIHHGGQKFILTHAA